MEHLDEACGIGVGSAGRVSGAMDTVRYEPCPSRNGSGCSTAGHKTKASAGCGTPWRGWDWWSDQFGVVQFRYAYLRTIVLMTWLVPERWLKFLIEFDGF